MYEIKYDGYRCLLYCSKEEVRMKSRNGQELGNSFPEVKHHITALLTVWTPFLPFVLDGELCILRNDKKADFEAIQLRGRLKNIEQVEKKSKQAPATFLAFDCLMKNSEWMTKLPLESRKEILSSLLSYGDVEDTIIPLRPLNKIQVQTDLSFIRSLVTESDGEGIVAKQIRSTWSAGTRTKQWLKWKNIKKGAFILTAYDQSNGFFHVAAIDSHEKLTSAGLFSHGLESEEREALIQIVKNNTSHQEGTVFYIPPFLCVELEYLELYKEQLRQPRFSRFLLNMHWEDCTWENVKKNSTPSQ
ncbi:RNA ligase family protein [Fictibacillus iocasae]|uniref:RNA ligase family protein n=1 Tax=Fictibacillus iocasae TaxID=2715437 RepID=A0ABW2NPX2_9BACL